MPHTRSGTSSTRTLTSSPRSSPPISTTSVSSAIKASQAIKRLAILRTTTPTIHSLLAAITTALSDFDTALSTFATQEILLSTLRSEHEAPPEGVIDPASPTLASLLAMTRLEPEELPDPEEQVMETFAREHAVILVAALSRASDNVQYLIDCLGTCYSGRTDDTCDALFLHDCSGISVLGKDVNRIRLRNVLRSLSASARELLTRIVTAVDEDKEVENEVKETWVAAFKTESERAARVVQRLKEAVVVFETIEVDWEGDESMDVESQSGTGIGGSDAGSACGLRAGTPPTGNDAMTPSWHGSGLHSPARSAASGKCYLCGRSPVVSPAGSVRSSHIPSSPARSLTGSACACGEDHVGVN
ncbi:hypothetical protein BU16DRAFT_532792 [Lophium mytilinum]|uniref:Uncharacterized protein n=1 Tax=Lophium mytilinum TaxID=390894 RepID=A0A6A6RFB5_9PEZI|nr:hypothetical protein BU16DRAFT_532792 [Lophium mytilinum]